MGASGANSGPGGLRAPRPRAEWHLADPRVLGLRHCGPRAPLTLPAGERGWRERLGEVVGTLRGWWSPWPAGAGGIGRVLQARPRGTVLAAGFRGLPTRSRPAPGGILLFLHWLPVEDLNLETVAKRAIPWLGWALNLLLILAVAPGLPFSTGDQRHCWPGAGGGG